PSVVPDARVPRWPDRLIGWRAAKRHPGQQKTNHDPKRCFSHKDLIHHATLPSCVAPLPGWLSTTQLLKTLTLSGFNRDYEQLNLSFTYNPLFFLMTTLLLLRKEIVRVRK